MHQSDAKQSGIDARRLNIPFHQNPYQYSGSKLKAQKRMWDIGWCEEDLVTRKNIVDAWIEKGE